MTWVSKLSCGWVESFSFIFLMFFKLFACEYMHQLVPLFIESFNPFFPATIDENKNYSPSPILLYNEKAKSFMFVIHVLEWMSHFVLGGLCFFFLLFIGYMSILTLAHGNNLSWDIRWHTHTLFERLKCKSNNGNDKRKRSQGTILNS